MSLQRAGSRVRRVGAPPAQKGEGVGSTGNPWQQALYVCMYIVQHATVCCITAYLYWRSCAPGFVGIQQVVGVLFGRLEYRNTLALHINGRPLSTSHRHLAKCSALLLKESYRLLLCALVDDLTDIQAHCLTGSNFDGVLGSGIPSRKAGTKCARASIARGAGRRKGARGAHGNICSCPCSQHTAHISGQTAQAHRHA